MATPVPPYTRWDGSAAGGVGEVQLGPNVRSLGAFAADGASTFNDVRVEGVLSADTIGPVDGLTIVSTLSNALAVGPMGDINPAFRVNCSASAATTGLMVAASMSGLGVALSVLSPMSSESLNISAKGAGRITLAAASTGGITLARPTTITGNTSTALAVGPSGTTNPSFVVDAATAGANTGIKVTALSSGSGVRISPVSPGTHESLYLDGKGSGPIYLGEFSSASIFIKRAVEASSVVWIDSSSANALAVGANGSANPAFRVDASATDSSTGLSVASVATSGGVVLSALSPGDDERLIMSAKGAGAVHLARDSTGDLIIGGGAGYMSFPTAAVPEPSVSATDSALVLTGDAAPYPVKRKALTAGFGEINSNAGFSAAQGATGLELVAASGCFGFQRVGGVVRLDYAIGLQLLAAAGDVDITVDLASLVVADGAAVPLPAGNVFANATSAWGVANIQSFGSAAHLSSAVSVEATATVIITVRSGGADWLGEPATASGTVYYRV